MTSQAHSVQTGLAGRFGWRPIIMIVGALLIAFSMVGILTPASAQAANVGGGSVTQCDGRLSGAGGAENIITCTVTIDNYIVNGTTSSRVSVSYVCSLNPCSSTGGSTGPGLVTGVDQCNGSGTLSAVVVHCDTIIRNHVSPNISPVLAATLNQCVGSSGAGTADLCNPATTSGAPVHQCNGSVTGGGGGIDCLLNPSTVSASLPVTVDQCNGTATYPGSFLVCRVTLSNDNDVSNAVIGAPTPTPTPTPTATVTPTPTPATPAGTPTTPAGSATPTGAPGGTPSGGVVPTAPGTLVTPTPTGTGTTPTGTGTTPTGTGTTPTGTGTTPTGTGTTGTGTSSQVGVVPTGGVQAGGGSTSGLQHVGLLALGGGLFLAAGASAIARRRFTRGS